MKLVLNDALVKRQGLSKEQTDIIYSLHQDRIIIEETMSQTKDKEQLKDLFNKWTENQYSLQEAWGFDNNITYHKWWWVPGCTCPKMDNDDAWPTGYYTRVINCPIHGEGNETVRSWE